MLKKKQYFYNTERFDEFMYNQKTPKYVKMANNLINLNNARSFYNLTTP